MMRILMILMILMISGNAKDPVIEEDKNIRIKKNYFDDGMLSDVLYTLKSTRIFAVVAYYKTGELAYSIIGYRKTNNTEQKVISRKAYSKKGDVKCTEEYQYYFKSESYEDMISDKQDGYQNMEDSKYLRSLVYFSYKNKFEFPKLSSKVKEDKISKFKEFIENEKMRKVVGCSYSGVKLYVEYDKGLFLDKNVLNYGSIKTPLSSEKRIKNALEAENLITKYFTRDKFTVFGIDTTLSF